MWYIIKNICINYQFLFASIRGRCERKICMAHSNSEEIAHCTPYGTSIGHSNFKECLHVINMKPENHILLKRKNMEPSPLSGLRQLARTDSFVLHRVCSLVVSIHEWHHTRSHAHVQIMVVLCRCVWRTEIIRKIKSNKNPVELARQAEGDGIIESNERKR